ncbi:type II secretion system F family protein [Candidatus Hydrogenedentota bacterium]
MRYSDMARWTFVMSLVTSQGTPTAGIIRKSIRGVSRIGIRRKLLCVADEIAEGRTLSDSMTTCGAYFPHYLTNMVRLGEMTGRLPHAFSQLSHYFDVMAPARRRLTFAWVFPIAFAALMTLVALALGSVVFSFEEAFSPVPGFFAVIVAAILVDQFVIERMRPAHRFLDRISKEVPIWGKVITDLCTFQFASSLELYFRAGHIPVVEKWKGAARSVDNLAIADTLLGGVELLESGEPLAQAMERTGLFGPDDISAIHEKEELGEFDSAFEALAERSRKRAEKRLRFFCLLTHRAVISVFVLLVLSLFVFLATTSGKKLKFEEMTSGIVSARTSNPRGAGSENNVAKENKQVVAEQNRSLILLSAFAKGALELTPALTLFLVFLAMLIRPREPKQTKAAAC